MLCAFSWIIVCCLPVSTARMLHTLNAHSCWLATSFGELSGELLPNVLPDTSTSSVTVSAPYSSRAARRLTAAPAPAAIKAGAVSMLLYTPSTLHTPARRYE